MESIASFKFRSVSFLPLILLTLSCQPEVKAISLEDSFLEVDAVEHAASVKVFKREVYSIIKKSGCVQCHSQAGSVVPFFADPNVEISHNTFLNYKLVNFEDTEESAIYLKITKDNHGLWFAKPDEVTQRTDALLNGINKWKPLGQKSSI
jgi:hypothetical protein